MTGRINYNKPPNKMETNEVLDLLADEIGLNMIVEDEYCPWYCVVLKKAHAKITELQSLGQLSELPDGMKGNHLIYRLTIQANGPLWRAGYYSPADGLWRLHADADTPAAAITALKEIALVTTTPAIV